jgi:hypothetical protein
MNDGIYPSPQYQKSDEYLQSGPQHTGILVTDFALDDFANGMRLCLELRPPLGLFDVDWGKYPIRPPERFLANSTSRAV